MHICSTNLNKGALNALSCKRLILMHVKWKRSACASAQFPLFVLLLYVPVSSYGHGGGGRSVHQTTLFMGRPEQAVNQFVTDSAKLLFPFWKV